MDSPEQRRKRKRLLRTSTSSSLKPSSSSLLPSHLLSVRSLLLYMSFFTLLYMLSVTIRYNSLVFRPNLRVSRLSFLSSSSDSSINSLQDFGDSVSLPIKIEDRVLFPDHILLLVKNDGIVKRFNGLDCVYEKSILVDERQSLDFAKLNVLSVDEYDEFRLIVRCPLPPVNYSAVVNLQRVGSTEIEGSRDDDNGLFGVSSSNLSVHSWENLVYDATLDGDTAVVFVKGLNLRQERESDPSQFNCHFGLKHLEKNGSFMFTTRAVTAAQEVVRCLLPRSIKMTPEKAQGIRVTIGVRPHVHLRGHPGNEILPSVAKISYSKSNEGVEMNQGKKYELCVCTMLWNQAAALREWITYHSWLGVERWFIYDNNSDDNIEQVIKELVKEDYNVSRHVWPWIKTQEAGFSHCAVRAKEECNWVSFMDVDEFFYFPNSSRNYMSWESGDAGPKSLSSLVANISSSSPTIAEIRTTCHSFGPSGLNSPPPRGVTVGYTCRLQRPERHKSIIRPEALDPTLLNVVHHFHLRSGFTYLNLHQGIAVINHYKYQVWDVFKAKFYRRVATYVADWQENHNEGSRDRAPGLGTEAIEPPNWSQQFCEIRDTGLRDFVLTNLTDDSTSLLPWERSSSDQ
ncbi:OLC1v1028127C1 [Oldenlandia corymbosa var. corymbosa]|uniref:Glycosyltransferase family 92 protein n=1 Tax=Oldenlandia corymbosa var. corymbosa TaxID=529605 RepID=A0AAV1CB02_OLDCO|nr:OLC1v1028127C1 [Oldenlandia corymbosa var. corymbosa]